MKNLSLANSSDSLSLRRRLVSIKRNTSDHSVLPNSNLAKRSPLDSTSYESPFEPSYESPFDFDGDRDLIVDGCPSTLQPAKPVGFLSFTMTGSHLPKPAPKPKYKQDIIAQWELLNKLFHPFPRSVMRGLYHNERGNVRAVANNLIERGWAVNDRNFLHLLRDESCQLFSVPYYFGLWQNSYKRVLRKAGEGSFMTNVISSEVSGTFQLSYYKSKQIHHKLIPFPQVAPAALQQVGLHTPIHRPLGLIFSDLAPFLF